MIKRKKPVKFSKSRAAGFAKPMTKAQIKFHAALLAAGRKRDKPEGDEPDTDPEIFDGGNGWGGG